MTDHGMTDHVERAAEVLVAHQRRDIGSCLCGWSELGQSHAVHVAQVLDRAKLIAAPVDGDLRETLAAILFDRTWSSIREDALPPEDQVWEAVRADVDALMPAITAHVAERDPEPVFCPECDGSGRSRITVKGNVADIDCPHCHGEGVTEP